MRACAVCYQWRITQGTSTLLLRGVSVQSVAPPPPSPHVPPPSPSLLRRAGAIFLPAGYPSSVAPCYLRYTAPASAAMVFSSAGGVLSTSALLVALGMGAAGAAASSVALNWVAKDGLGQLGGMLYASFLGGRFDADPKRWRFVSALALDAAGALEVALALAPPGTVPFLPVAAVANVGKNVAWLSASATRAGLHAALARRGNLGDITAKAGSQATAASTLGTALGLALAPFLGGDPVATCVAFGALSCAHLSCVALSLSGMALPTLSDTRLRLAVGDFVTSHATPQAGWVAHTPTHVSLLERFLPSPFPAPLDEAHIAPVLIGAPLHNVPHLAAFAHASGALGGGSRFILIAPPSRSSGGAVRVLLLTEATWQDVLCGHLAAMRAHVELSIQGGGDGDGSVEAVRRARDWAVRALPVYVSGLEAAGWWVGQPLIEDDTGSRISVANAI